jgi:hypothetical protein
MLVAVTLKVYFNPFVRLLLNVQASGVGKLTLNVHVNDGVIATPFSSNASTV